MDNNPYILEYEGPFQPGEQIRFQAKEADMPAEIELQNDIAELLENYHRHPDFFDPFELEVAVSDFYFYLVYQYQNVLQYYLKGNDDTRFLILHYDFVINHYIAEIEKKGATNARMEAMDVLQDLFFFLDKDAAIENISGFESAEAVKDLFFALKDLYNGDSSKYLKFLFKVL